MNEDCFLTKQFIQHNVDKSNMKSYFYLLFLQYLYNFVKDDSKISFKHSSEQSFTDDDIQDTIILKEQIQKIKDTKDKLKFDVRKNAIEFVKQKGNIDDMIKELDSIEEKGLDDKQLISSLYSIKHIREDKLDELDTEQLKFIENNNKIINNYRNILQNNVVDTYKKDIDKINMSKEDKLEIFKRKDNKVFNHYIILELLKIIGINYDVEKIQNDDVLIMTDDKNTWINERTYNFTNMIKDFGPWVTQKIPTQAPRIIEWMGENQGAVRALFSTFVNIALLKDKLIKDLDNQDQDIKADIKGVSGHEGYVGDGIKLVDRDKFSRVNFAANNPGAT